jgi:hypothetical protein
MNIHEYSEYLDYFFDTLVMVKLRFERLNRLDCWLGNAFKALLYQSPRRPIKIIHDSRQLLPLTLFSIF